jgi:hypothetical protein
MPSFISILKKIEQIAIGIEHVAAPIAETLLPQFAPLIARVDGMFTNLQTAVATVEMNSPVDGQGALKAQAVTADFEAGLAFTQSVLAPSNLKLSYDEMALQEAIAAQVTAFNAMAKVKASFKVVPLNPTS